MANKKVMLENKKILQIILITAIILVVTSILYSIIKLAIAPTEVFMVQNDSISNTESAVGYIIREEKITKGQNYKNGMQQIKAEGEKVAKGDNIFRYYANNEEDVKQKISKINSEIQKALNGQNNLFSNDLNAIDNQISDKLEGINKKNDLQEIKEFKNDIDKYILKKSKIAGDLSQAGSYVNELIKEKSEYDNQLRQNSEYIVAPISGVVSYRIDDLEEALTPDNFENITEEFLQNLNLKTGQIVSTNSQYGKVINNYECYIATVLESSEAKKTEVGDRLTIKLSTQDKIIAKVAYKKEERNKVILVLKINSCVEKLIDYRKITFDIIWWEYEGLKIPKNAIYYNNGLAYVVRNRGGYLNKILVEILRESDNYCIVDNYDSEDLKEMGYTPTEIINMRKISLYDEILINPDIKDIN